MLKWSTRHSRGRPNLFLGQVYRSWIRLEYVCWSNIHTPKDPVASPVRFNFILMLIATQEVCYAHPHQFGDPHCILASFLLATLTLWCFSLSSNKEIREHKRLTSFLNYLELTITHANSAHSLLPRTSHTALILFERDWNKGSCTVSTTVSLFCCKGSLLGWIVSLSLILPYNLVKLEHKTVFQVVGLCQRSSGMMITTN